MGSFWCSPWNLFVTDIVLLSTAKGEIGMDLLSNFIGFDFPVQSFDSVFLLVHTTSIQFYQYVFSS